MVRGAEGGPLVPGDNFHCAISKATIGYQTDLHTSHSTPSQIQSWDASESTLQHFMECAPLTEQQEAAIFTLSQAVAERPYPSELGNGNSLTVSRDGDRTDSLATDTILVNRHQFYEWFANIEAAMKLETENKYQNYVDTLTEHIKTCDNVLDLVDDTLNLLDELQLQHKAVSTKTKTLHDACDQLLMEKQKMVEFADLLRSKLKYFDELENISRDFYSPSTSITSGNFLPLLKRLDECILYMQSNPQYAESRVYLVKFRQLQSRALSTIRSHVVSVLKNASSQVHSAIRSSDEKRISAFGSIETSILYARFKAIAGELKPVLEEIEGRSSRKEYAQILSDCQKSYCDQRLFLVKRVVQQRISEFSKREKLASLTRLGCAYLMQVCQLEHQLFSHFFASSSGNNSCLAPLVDPLCTILYDTLRPKFIHEANLDVLCELVEILKVEVLGEQLNRRSESSTQMRPTIQRLFEDVHERLTFRVRTYIRDEIENFSPSDKDLDYPERLEQSVSVDPENASDETGDISKTWYPPLLKTSAALSKLYSCLESSVFTELAQEAVDVCSISIQKARKLIAKRSSAMDGQLFLIKHILILREQIAPLDIEFSTTQKELDFSHLLEHLRRILRGQVLFDWSRPTTLARTLSPRVFENQRDAKKELDKCLKATCEEFIMSVTKVIVDPMLSFTTKVSAVNGTLASNGQHKEGDSLLAKPLKDQVFAKPDKVFELVQNVMSRIHQDLPNAVAKMKCYLTNSSTQAILFKPIKTNILEAHLQVLSLVNSEYSVEEIQEIHMMQMQDLEALLDGLF